MHHNQDELRQLESAEHRASLKAGKAPRVLLEMRPALDGFAGIPQETRLLFRGLCMIGNVKVEGMIQASMRILAKGTADRALFLGADRLSEATRINRYSRVIISMGEKPYATIVDKVLDWFERKLISAGLTTSTLLGLKKVKLSRFRALHFEDFLWRTLFAKTLPAGDFDLVSGRDQRICSTPWHTMHMAGLYSLNFLPNPVYPRLDTRDVDIFIGQTPYPGRVDSSTAMVIRYHDALPVFMPHTIGDKSLHQATHFYALKSNVRSGAWFACVSDATRNDLLKLFPEAAKRAVTIHNMVSHHYVDRPAAASLVPGIIRSRLYEGDGEKNYSLMPKFFSNREKENFYVKHLGGKNFRYLLIVSTIEPRKNHSRLMAAWEVIKADIDPDLKLVVVGTLGWDVKAIVTSFGEWIARGQLFSLHAVPAPDLRVLYQHAAATVCPSLGEGFDFSGVEAMASGGVAVGSDIPVHREVFGDAAEYFDPYATTSLVQALKRVLYDTDAPANAERLRQRGKDIAARYRPEMILPQWEAFLGRVMTEKKGLFGRRTAAAQAASRALPAVAADDAADVASPPRPEAAAAAAALAAAAATATATAATATATATTATPASRDHEPTAL
jgi:glycosyltransferase involved in cell wall biosynthesis